MQLWYNLRETTYRRDARNRFGADHRDHEQLICSEDRSSMHQTQAASKYAPGLLPTESNASSTLNTSLET